MIFKALASKPVWCGKNTSAHIPWIGMICAFYKLEKLRSSEPNRATHQWLFQISMKLPPAKIELGPIYDRLVLKFSFSGLKMRLSGL